MNTIVAKAALGVCLLAFPLPAHLGAAEPVVAETAPLTLEDLGRMAEANLQKVEVLIEERKVADRSAERDAEARKVFERGLRLSQSGDLEGAKRAWQEALEMSQRGGAYSASVEPQRQPEKRSEAPQAAPRASSRSGQADWLGDISLATASELKAAVQARITVTNAEGEALFKEDRLDEAEAKFQEVLRLDPSNLKAREYASSLLPKRRESLRRIAEAEQSAKTIFERGARLYAAGDLLGARAAWVEAINITEIPATKMGMTARVARLDTEIAVLYTRIDGLNNEGATLYDADRLDEAEAKFREVLKLEATNLKAMQYLDVAIPKRREALASKAAIEEKALAIFEQGNRLYGSGDIDGAMLAWQTAMATTESVALKARITAQVSMAEEKKRQEVEALQARIAGLYAEGVALFDIDRFDEAKAKFKEVLSLDRNHLGARQYLDHKIAARKADIARKSEAEEDARKAMERGNKLYAAGSFEEAQAAWKEALEITQQQR